MQEPSQRTCHFPSFVFPNSSANLHVAGPAHPAPAHTRPAGADISGGGSLCLDALLLSARPSTLAPSPPLGRSTRLSPPWGTGSELHPVRTFPRYGLSWEWRVPSAPGPAARSPGLPAGLSGIRSYSCCSAGRSALSSRPCSWRLSPEWTLPVGSGVASCTPVLAPPPSSVTLLLSSCFPPRHETA